MDSASFPVTLHVYDLSSGMAKNFSRQLVGSQINGVYHTGFVIYGKEFYYGGGISYDLPSRTPFGTPTKAISLGETEVPEEIFMEMLKDMATKFTDRTYHVFTNNANTFTSEVAEMVLGEAIPTEYSQLPREFYQTGLGQQIAPIMVNMQKSLQLSANQLFANEAVAIPLQVRRPENEQQPGQAPGMDNPAIQQMMQQMAGGNPNAQGAGAAGQTASPQLGEVCHITSLVQLQTIIRTYQGVVIDFWSPRCGPCMRFKPTYEGACRANRNKHIVFCAVQTDNNREACQAFQVQSIPQFNFILNGEESSKFVGASEPQFRNALGKLQMALDGKASSHMNQTYKQFRPMNRLPMSFTAKGQEEKMKQFISNFAKASASRVGSTTNLLQWIEGGFNLEAIPKKAIDELSALALVAEDKNKIAVCDLFRLLVLKGEQVEYILGQHWTLVDKSIIQYLQGQNLSDPENKTVHNFHQMSLKMLANIFSTSQGKAIMQDVKRAKTLIEFCNRSFTSCNAKVVQHSGFVLFNQLLSYEKDHKRDIQQELEQAMKSIDEAVTSASFSDKDCLLSLLLCECRILYKNEDMVTWVEEQFKLFFKETHSDLETRAQQAEVKEAIQDLFSMVSLD